MSFSRLARGDSDVFFLGYRILCAQPPLPFQGRGRGRGVGKHGSPRRGESLRAIPKTLKIVGFRDFQLSPLPKIGEGFGEWFEVLLRTRRIRWL